MRNLLIVALSACMAGAPSAVVGAETPPPATAPKPPAPAVKILRTRVHNAKTAEEAMQKAEKSCPGWRALFAKRAMGRFAERTWTVTLGRKKEPEAPSPKPD